MATRGNVQNILIRYSTHLHYIRKLIDLVFTREYWVASVEFSNDAAKGPHVNGSIVRNSQHDLRGPVEPTLNVSINLLVLEAAGTEIDDLDTGLVDFP